MTTRVLTETQKNKVCVVLTQMAVTLNQMGFPWPDEAQADLNAAFAAMGEEAPFQFVTRPQEEEAAPSRLVS